MIQNDKSRNIKAILSHSYKKMEIMEVMNNLPFFKGERTDA